MKVKGNRKGVLSLTFLAAVFCVGRFRTLGQ
jgi:hypothetical protein